MVMPHSQDLVAAADLGSNSFRLLIARVVDSPSGLQITPIDSLKETVRLAGGLGPDQRLDADSQARALQALQRFGLRLQSFSSDRVRAVATNALRVAKNGRDFLHSAEAALGFPIEIISGHEEARLIYCGVAHGLARDDRRRLIIDIGGGSTEFIIGSNHEPEVLESIDMGCVRFSREYFPDGRISGPAMESAMRAAVSDIALIRESFVARGWDEALGSSGTAKAIAEVSAKNGFSPQGMTSAGLERLRAVLVRAGRAEDAGLTGLRPDRMPVFAGGVAIMSAIFESFGIAQMRYADGALRLGLLHALVGPMAASGSPQPASAARQAGQSGN